MHKLFVDGASRGNPGPASAGASLVFDGKEIATVSEKIENQTNNFAEYSALMLGLECALAKDVKSIAVYADSQLMVRQVMGQYKVKSKNIKPLFLKVKEFVAQFEEFEIHHIPREENERADELANLALDS